MGNGEGPISVNVVDETLAVCNRCLDDIIFLSIVEGRSVAHV